MEKVEFKLRWEEKAELVELSAVIDKVSEIVHTAR